MIIIINSIYSSLHFLQVYKIANLNLDNKWIFIAGGSLYTLLQMEAAIITTVHQVNPHEVENKFNNIVAAAVEDYKGTMEGIVENGKWFEIELMTNFNDFFNACIDLKKREAEEMKKEAEKFAQMERNVAAHVAEEMEKNVAAVVAAAAENNVSAPPAKKARK